MNKILMFLTLLFSMHANAELLSKQYSNCMEKGSTNSEWSTCATKEIAFQEKALNNAWSEVAKEMKTYSQNAFKSLLNEQRAWIKYKDEACQYYAATDDGGSPTFGREGTALHYGLCKATIIAERVNYLKVAIPSSEY
ncbi:MAG: hypothetical protein CTY33_02870 [Methylotenera sp.]|nr:MAG: hypothetical protein CTY33_02870 [Methylotenera sp.]